MKKIIFAMAAVLLAAVVFAQVPGMPPSGGGAGAPEGAGGLPPSPGQITGPGGTTADTTDPMITITSPASRSTTAASVTIKGTASDASGIASVTYTLSGATTGSGDVTGKTSWLFLANLAEGTTTITVTARDNAGRTKTATIPMTYNAPVNGACGSAGPFYRSPQPSSATPGLCQSGDVDNFRGFGPWTWTCKGKYNGENSLQCKAEYKEDARCGSASGGKFDSQPSSNLCMPDSASAAFLPSGDGWLWICKGINGGKDSPQCSAQIQTSDDKTPPSISIISPSDDASIKGNDLETTITVSGTSIDAASISYELSGAAEGKGTIAAAASWSFRVTIGEGETRIAVSALDAAGNKATDSITITYKKLVQARCGTSNGGRFDMAPSDGLCAPGTAGEVNNVGGKWRWACIADANDACSADVISAGAPAPIKTVAASKCAGFRYRIRDCRSIEGPSYSGSCQTTCNPETGLETDCTPTCVRVFALGIAPAGAGMRSQSPVRFVKPSTAVIAESTASDPDGDPVRLFCGTTIGARDVCAGEYYASNPSCGSYRVQWDDNTNHEIYCFVEDKPKGIEPAKVSDMAIVTLTADSIAPAVSVAGPSSQWQNTDTTASASCSDANGCSETRMRTYSIAEKPVACPQTLNDYLQTTTYPVSESLWACAAGRDAAGNEGFSSLAEFKIDKTAPVSSILCNGAACLNTYEANSVAISFSVSDAGSQVKEIRYTVNGGPEQVYNAEFPETINHHGHYTIEYWAVDNAGNAEAKKTAAIFLNKNKLTQELVITLDFVKIIDGNEKATNFIRIGTPKENFFARLRCFTRNIDTKEKVEDCTQDNTRITSFEIDTKTGTHNYLSENPGLMRWNSAEGAWRFPIDTNTYQSIVRGCADHDGVSGCGSGEYSAVNSVMNIEVSYPDLQNFIVPATATGAPNFTRSMSILFNAKPVVTNDFETYACTGDDCIALYSMDGGAEEQAMEWDDFAGAFRADPPSAGLACDQYHMIRIKAKKVAEPDKNLEAEADSTFFVSCVPRVTVNPVERRLVTGAANILAFNVTVWNPLEAQNFGLEMASAETSRQFVLEWLSMRCGSADGCSADDDTASMTIDAVSSKSVYVDMSIAGKSGIYPIKFTASAGDRQYESRGTLQIFAEGLSEFSAWQLAAAVSMLLLLIWHRPDMISKRKRK